MSGDNAETENGLEISKRGIWAADVKLLKPPGRCQKKSVARNAYQTKKEANRKLLWPAGRQRRAGCSQIISPLGNQPLIWLTGGEIQRKEAEPKKLKVWGRGGWGAVLSHCQSETGLGWLVIRRNQPQNTSDWAQGSCAWGKQSTGVSLNRSHLSTQLGGWEEDKRRRQRLFDDDTQSESKIEQMVMTTNNQKILLDRLCRTVFRSDHLFKLLLKINRFNPIL